MATFSKASFNAAAYLKFRPDYSPRLYSALFNYHRGQRDLAVDVGTGTCQVAKALAPLFGMVQATDPSETMVKSASTNVASNITVSVASAEQLPFPDTSADLVVSGQAAHWFELSKFYAEAYRLLKADGTVCVWSYSFCQFPQLPDATQRFRSFAVGTGPGQLGPYWESGRQIVDDKYPGFEDVARAAGFKDVERWEYPAKGQMIEKNFSLNDFQQYLKTWSAYKTYGDRHPAQPDPVDVFTEDMAKREKVTDREEVWEVEWPGVVIIGRK
ncbi:S-adenosyl-L-methionine-dependent methyltransferase [Powellomyces hirtus]|nr:S-adenosyl-L-methionine-dependent methyltransferase [Powellomyces hirtus]